MNYISKTHQEFLERLKDPRVLSNPEEFLGPNFEAVLNFWLSLDDLTKNRWETIKGCYRSFYVYRNLEWCNAAAVADNASRQTIGLGFVNKAACAADDFYGSAALHATKELIGMHKFFQQQKLLTFFPMFLEVL